LIEADEALGLGQGLPDKQGVEVFEVGEAHELGAGGLVADVALFAGVLAPPLGGRLAEEGHVQHIGLAGIDEAGLGFAQLRRDEMGLDGVGVDAVVDLGEVAADVPAEGLALGFLEPLKFLNQVELELHRDPRGELQGDVQVGISAAVAPGLGLDADGPGALGPLLGGQDETVEPSHFSNPIEFDGIKTGIVDLLPQAEEFEGVAVSEPVGDQVVRALRVFVASDIGQADIILIVDPGEADFTGENFDFLRHRRGF
jgi:hypothetical protein